MNPLLSVRDLRTTFRTEAGTIAAVDGVSFDVGSGEVLGIVGESGSGKSVTALSILRLLPPGSACRFEGSIRFDGRNLLDLPKREIERIRGREIGMIFQEPMTSLNPVFTIGNQLAEPLRWHEGLSSAAARARSAELLARVGIPDPAARLDSYPHQLSGGMRQRVMIAMALACRPRILIADEPTTALDVTIQAQVLDLLRALQAEMNLAIILITHDLGVIADIADRVIVMYAGRVVEAASADSLFAEPGHPYTSGLLASVPDIDDDGGRRMNTIPGVVPNPLDYPPGCRFAPRCGFRREACDQAYPALAPIRGEAHLAACIRHAGYRPGGTGMVGA